MPDSWVFGCCLVSLFSKHAHTYKHIQNANNTTNIEQHRAIKTDFYYTHWLVLFFFAFSVLSVALNGSARVCLCFFLRAQSLFSHFYFYSPCEIEFIFRTHFDISVWHCPYKVNEWMRVCVCVLYLLFHTFIHNAIRQWTMAPIKSSILIPYSAFLAWNEKRILFQFYSTSSTLNVLSSSSSFHLIVSLVVIFQLLCERHRHIFTHTHTQHLKRQTRKNKSKISQRKTENTKTWAGDKG